MSVTGSSEVTLSKLTVPQLKALCKGKKVTGYSKLGKQALIQKLLETGYSPSDAPISTVFLDPADPHTLCGNAGCDVPQSVLNASAKFVGKPEASKSKANIKTTAPNIAPSTAFDHIMAPIQPVTTLKSTANTACAPPEMYSVAASSLPLAARVGQDLETVYLVSPGSNEEQSVSPAISCSADDATGSGPVAIIQTQLKKGQKRLRADEQNMRPPPKKARIHLVARVTSLSTTSRTLMPPPLVVFAAHSRPSCVKTTTSPAPVDVAEASLPPAKRFKPLVIDKNKLCLTPAACVTGETLATTHLIDSAHAGMHYLDFPLPVSPIPALRSITLPPPLAQRKRVACWAIILSGLSDNERTVCALVSRTFRYAVYMSASSILACDYRGRRLQDDVLNIYSQAMTNMWPYLRIRQAEVAKWRRTYEASFLPRFFRRCGVTDPIAVPLWASPDNTRQIVIALRFTLTRAWFALSLGSPQGTKDNPVSWLQGTVVDVQEVVRDEIWSVDLQYPNTPGGQMRGRETLYVLDATCEVIGRSPRGPSKSESPNSASSLIRADWSGYIASRSTVPSANEASLLSRIKWPRREEFDRGISKLWLNRIATEGAHGLLKRAVAERYVLASVVGNSISGQWMPASAMAQEFAGLPARTAPVASEGSKGLALNLYLPEHHHVESVHFTTPRGARLHAALAVVQTPHREYYILRDNGMQVGCEEEGVAAIWQEVLGCDHQGLHHELCVGGAHSL